MSPEEKLYVAQISARIVGMFQRYSERVNPANEQFLAFMDRYLADEGVKNPRAIPYPELYKRIRQGIVAYLQQLNLKDKTTKDEAISR